MRIVLFNSWLYRHKSVVGNAIFQNLYLCKMLVYNLSFSKKIMRTVEEVLFIYTSLGALLTHSKFKYNFGRTFIVLRIFL